jgi:hypothetical protein
MASHISTNMVNVEASCQTLFHTLGPRYRAKRVVIKDF